MGAYLTSDAAYRTLWLSVVRQAMDEAEGKSLHGVGKYEVDKTIRRARKWLMKGSTSFIEVCRLAGMSLEQRKLLHERMVGLYG